MANAGQRTPILIGGFVLDLDRETLSGAGGEVRLRPKTFEVLRYLLMHRGRVVTKQALIDEVWRNTSVTDDSLVQCLIEIRRALGDNDHRLIETIPRRGYMMADSDAEADAPHAIRKTPSRQLWFTVALACFIVGLVAGAWWLIPRGNTPIRIAVLPLENLSREPDNDYFADGLTDEIITNLSVIEDLEVRARTSSFAFKGKSLSVRDVGAQLDVDYVLEGSVMRTRETLRINARLVRVRDDSPRWSGRFERKLTDVFAIQDEISRGIVNSLRLSLGRGRRRYETSVEAYDFYLRARALEGQQIAGRPTFRQIVQHFEAAIAKDPAFAPAYAGLGAAYALRSVQFAVATTLTDEAAKMHAAAEKAVQLDPLLAEAHETLGAMYAYDGQWQQAEASFIRAIELDPNRSRTYELYSYWLLTVLGRIDEALTQLRIAERIDPLSPRLQGILADVLIAADRFDEAAGRCSRAATNRSFRYQCLARTRLQQGKTADAVRMMLSDPTLEHNPQARGFLGYARARAGRREEAEQMAAAAEYPNEQALIFAGLEDKDRTLDALERAASLGPQRVGLYLAGPEFAFLRGDARLGVLRSKLGLPH